MTTIDPAVAIALIGLLGIILKRKDLKSLLPKSKVAILHEQLQKAEERAIEAEKKYDALVRLSKSRGRKPKEEK